MSRALLLGLLLMTFGVDATSHTAAVLASTTKTWAHTCGASANKLEVLEAAGAGVIGTRTVSSVTYNGVSCTHISGATADDGTFERCEGWKLDSPPTGSAFNIVVTWGGAVDQGFGVGISFNDAATAEGTVATNTGTTTNPSVTVADSLSGDHVISVLANDNSTAATTEGGTLIGEDEDVGSDSDFNAQRQVATGANTVCSWTCSASGSKWATLGYAVKPAVAPPIDRGTRLRQILIGHRPRPFAPGIGR